MRSRYPTALVAWASDEIWNLSRATGGTGLVVSELGDPLAHSNPEALTKYAYALARLSYQIKIEADHPIVKPAKLKLTIVLAGRKTKSWTPLYPHELPGCRP
jgi:hypothetical protein